MEWDTVSIDEMIDDIYQVLLERADGEEDQEAIEYNEYLISSMEMIREYIHLIEVKLRKKNEVLNESSIIQPRTKNS